MASFEITTLDIARFFYNRDVSNRRKPEIILDLWRNRGEFLECYLYDNLRIFSNEVNNLLLDLSLNNIINEETEEIIRIQNDLEFNYSEYGLHSLNENKIEDSLKECKLRILYESKNKYIYMKMKTLVRSCGYRKRSKKFSNDLIKFLFNLDLYITDGSTELRRFDQSEYMKVTDIKMDSYIWIYSY